MTRIGSRRPPPRVAVVGAGAGGIAMGAGLARAGVEYEIFERSDGLGGTWYDNVYPGAEVDTAQPLYSFSFSRYNFSRTHVKQPELLAYLRHTAERFGLLPHLRLKTAVTRTVWDEQTHKYAVWVSRAGAEPTELPDRYDVVVSAVGLLNEPRYPDWPGMDHFGGVLFHSARWEDQHDLAGKRVAVVGTGSSGAQLVSALAPVVGQLYVFQRQPGWLLPKEEHVFTAHERAQLMNPRTIALTRYKQRMVYEKARRANVESSKANRNGQRTALAYIDKVFADRPDLAKLVTPDYPYGGKRTVRDSNFYPALLRANVELVPHAVTELSATGIVDGTGLERAVDVVVLCSGFQPASFLRSLEVVGRDGRTLHDVWNGDAEAFLGLTVSNFPNFYMLYGPNTNGGAPIMWMHERQVEFVLRDIARMTRHGLTALEVRPFALRVFNRILQRRLSEQVVDKYQDVHNYSRAESGRNVLGWGEGLLVYALLTRMLRRVSASGRRLSDGRGQDGLTP